jgi:hypothetical protein
VRSDNFVRDSVVSSAKFWQLELPRQREIDVLVRDKVKLYRRVSKSNATLDRVFLHKLDVSEIESAMFDQDGTYGPPWIRDRALNDDVLRRDVCCRHLRHYSMEVHADSTPSRRWVGTFVLALIAIIAVAALMVPRV